MEFDAARPIWLQLVSEFSRRIAVARWASGERMPGVRDLAAELGVNPNTVQRALAELERQGLARTERTTGRFVTDSADRIRDLRKELAGEAATDYITRAHGLGLDRDAALDLVSERWERDAGASLEPGAAG